MVNKYPVSCFDFGSELELADVDTSIVLPEGNEWNSQETDITNSNGIGNDPWKKLNRYGGQVNVKPTATIQEQVEQTRKVFEVLKDKMSINYSLFYHTHIGVPGLYKDIENIKKAVTYFYKHQEDIWKVCFSTFPKPIKKDYATQEDFKLASEAYKFENSFVFNFSENKYNYMMKSKTPEQFYLSRLGFNEETGKHGIMHRRMHVNFMQLFDPSHTIEFRMFQPTLDLKEIESCLWYSRQLVNAMLNTGLSPKEIVAQRTDLVFPKPLPLNLEMFKIFKLTGKHTDAYSHKKRKEALVNIAKLIQIGYITKEDVGWFSDTQPLQDMKLVHKSPNK